MACTFFARTAPLVCQRSLPDIIASTITPSSGYVTGVFDTMAAATAMLPVQCVCDAKVVFVAGEPLTDFASAFIPLRQAPRLASYITAG